jgi:hypothetical protein
VNFKPPTAAEIEARKLWPKGTYDFVITDAEEKMSRNRNPMIEVTMTITRRDGATRVLKDYLMVQRPEKLMHAALACDVIDKYHAGSLSDDDFVGKSGSVKIGIEKSKEFPDKNVVLDYV